MRASERDTAHLHPSELSHKYWCPRASYYRITDAPSNGKPLSFRMENIFAEGHDIHDKWQRWFADIGILHGFWECRQCGHYWEDLSPPKCPKCKETRPRYREVPLEIPEYHIIGHSDGRIIDSQGRALLEVKSIGLGTVKIEHPILYRRYVEESMTLDSLWSSIRVPFPSHLKQGMLYLHATGEKEIIYVYESKFNQAVKEFTVRYRQELIQPILDQCADVMKSVRSEFPPMRPEWAYLGHDECQRCPFKKECYDQVDQPKQDDERPVRIIKSARKGGKGTRRKAA